MNKQNIMAIAGVGIIFVASALGWVLSSTDAGYLLSEGIKLYCEVPMDRRLVLRNTVAKSTTPNVIEIHCQGDDP